MIRLFKIICTLFVDYLFWIICSGLFEIWIILEQSLSVSKLEQSAVGSLSLESLSSWPRARHEESLYCYSAFLMPGRFRRRTQEHMLMIRPVLQPTDRY